MNVYRCKKCKSTLTFVRRNDKNPNMVGVYCKSCGAWIKWLSKQEQSNITIEDYVECQQHPKDVSQQDDIVLQLIDEIDLALKNARVFKTTGDKYVMVRDIASILGNFIYEHNIHRK